MAEDFCQDKPGFIVKFEHELWLLCLDGKYSIKWVVSYI